MTEQKPTIIFLPGLGEDHRFYKHQTAAFPNSYAADWIDPLPHEILEQYAVRFAAVIRTELDKRPAAPVVVCGHSLGGMVAPYVVRELNASAYILLASIRSPEQFPKRYYLGWLLTRFHPLRLTLLFIARLIARFFLCFPWLWGWFICPKIVRAQVEMPLFRFSELLRIMLEWAYRRRSPEKTEFDKPALQIHATNDWLLPIRSTNPDIRIGSGGHLIPFTHSEKINAIIEGFVAGLGTPS